MTIERQWQLVQVAEPLVPIGVTLILLYALSWPRRLHWRAVVAVILAWIVNCVFDTELLNPVGIAHAERAGVKRPWEGFDNNDNLGVLVLGWLFPTITVAIALLCSWAWGRFRHCLPHGANPSDTTARSQEDHDEGI